MRMLYVLVLKSLFFMFVKGVCRVSGVMFGLIKLLCCWGFKKGYGLRFVVEFVWFEGCGGVVLKYEVVCGCFVFLCMGCSMILLLGCFFCEVHLVLY